MPPLHTEPYPVYPPFYVVPAGPSTWYRHAYPHHHQYFAPPWMLPSIPIWPSSPPPLAQKVAEPHPYARYNMLRAGQIPPAPLLKTKPLPGTSLQYCYALPDMRKTDPYTTTADTTVDPLIFFSPHSYHQPPMSWDMMQHPATIYKAHGALRAPCALRSSRDGRQPLKSLVLIFPHVPMEIEIYPSDPKSPYLTVRDLLYGLYTQLQKLVASKELQKLDPLKRVLLERAAKLRTGGPPDSRAEVRKIDYLFQDRRFLGIYPAPKDILAAREDEKGGVEKLKNVFLVKVGSVDKP